MSYWSCSSCTFANKGTDLNCQACGAKAPRNVAGAYNQRTIPSFAPSQTSGAPPAYAPHYVPPPATAPSASATIYNPAATTATAYVPATAPTAPSATPTVYTPAASGVTPYVPATAVPATVSATPVSAVAYPAPAAPSEMSEDVPNDLWICPGCTWVNKSADSSCKACGHNAPAGVKPVQAPSAPSYNPVVVTAQALPVTASIAPQAPADDFASGFGNPVSTPAVSSNTSGAYNPYAAPAAASAASVPAFNPYANATSPTSTSYDYNNSTTQTSSSYNYTPTPPPPTSAPASAQKQQSNDDFVSGFTSHRFDASVLNQPGLPTRPNNARSTYPGGSSLPTSVHANLYG